MKNLLYLLLKSSLNGERKRFLPAFRKGPCSIPERVPGDAEGNVRSLLRRFPGNGATSGGSAAFSGPASSPGKDRHRPLANTLHCVLRRNALKSRVRSLGPGTGYTKSFCSFPGSQVWLRAANSHLATNYHRRPRRETQAVFSWWNSRKCLNLSLISQVMKLEEAIVYSLATSGGGLKVEWLVDKINREGLHRRKDGQPVTLAQVYAVVMSHPEMFCKSEGRIRLLI